MTGLISTLNDLEDERYHRSILSEDTNKKYIGFDNNYSVIFSKKHYGSTSVTYFNSSKMNNRDELNEYLQSLKS